MSTLDKLYTLESPIFRAGIIAGYSSHAAVSKPTLIVGGAAVQLSVQDPEFLRPTNDVDISVVDILPKSQRKMWARYASAEASKLGYSSKGELTRYGAEIRFNGLDIDFIVHLDCFSQEFFKKYEHIFKAEYERSELYDVDGVKVRAKSPVDLLANKIRKMRSLVFHRNATLNSQQKQVILQLESGRVDEVDTGDLKKRLKTVTSKRKKSIEDLGREGCIEILNDINGYVLEKDFYDVLLIVESSRRNKKSIDSKILQESLAIQRDLYVTSQ